MDYLFELLQIKSGLGMLGKMINADETLEMAYIPFPYESSTVVVVSAPLLTGLIVRGWVIRDDFQIIVNQAVNTSTPDVLKL